MRHIVHDASPPLSLQAAYRANPHPLNPYQAWKEFDSRELRERLWELQSGLCAYCERTLDIGPGCTTIEHIIPKSRHPDQTFQYFNLVLCCADPNTCNLYKRGKYFAGADDTGRWREGFIGPTQPRCATTFSYKRSGEVVPSETAVQDDARDTIAIVNLNFEALKTERREYLERIESVIVSMSDQLDALRVYLAKELCLGSLKPFYSAKHQHFLVPT